MGGGKERPVHLGMENNFFEAEGEGSFAGGNKRAALGGRRPPRRRHAAGPAGRPAAAPGGPADKSMAAGGAADAKKARKSGGKCKPRLDKGERSPYNIFVSVQGREQCALLPQRTATPKRSGDLPEEKERGTVKLDLNRVLELPGEADVVTADVDLTTVKHAGRPLFTAPVNVTAKAVNRAGVVTLDCTYRFTLHVLCDRCLAPLELPVDRTVSHTVVREVNGEDDETFLVAENGCVELEELATNDILPELPQRYLCREDCRGLCPTCGKNLNEGPCGCREDSGDPRMDVLRRLLEN